RLSNEASGRSGDRLIPKLEDPDSCYVRRRWDIHCKNVRWSNGIWAHCSGADGGADESMSPQFGISWASGVEVTPSGLKRNNRPNKQAYTKILVRTPRRTSLHDGSTARAPSASTDIS